MQQKNGSGSSVGRWLRPLAVGVCVVASGLFVARTLQDVDPREALRLCLLVGPFGLLILAPQWLGLALETVGWRSTIREVGGRVALLPLFAVRVLTEAWGQILPGGAVVAESMKPVLLERRCGLPLALGVGATVHRKYLRLVTHGLYVISAALWGGAALDRASAAHFGGIPLQATLLVSGVVLLVLAQASSLWFGRGRTATRLWLVLRRVRWSAVRDWTRRARSDFALVDRATRAYFGLGPTKTALPIFLCWVAWCTEAIESWLLLRLLGIEVPLSLLIGFDVALSLVKQLLFFLPAGIGVQEAGYLAVLAALGVPDVATVGAAFLLLKRLKEASFCVVALAVGSAFERRGPAAEARIAPHPV